ncbi:MULTISPECIES: GrpB family protein [Streptomyces]|uniref:GrpB family protein n=1 Tax=Streptomyces TaxID=1883 RepID=UPI001595E40B|nr:GrpB family protein [Streptomyces sp. CAI-17]
MPDQQPPDRPEDRTIMTDAEIEAAYVTTPPRLDGPVTLAPYDPRWPEAYAALAARIGERLTPLPHRLDHAGSTSVPGLPAKPVLDLVLTVPDPADEDAYVPALAPLGLRLTIREPDWYAHRLLRGTAGHPAADAVNLHVFPEGCPETARMLRFRDHLRADAADRDLYARTKRELSARSWTYTQQYADAKSEVVAEILRRAG